MKHRSIIVTSNIPAAIEAAHEEAAAWDLSPTMLPDREMRGGFKSFMIPPDGVPDDAPDRAYHDEARRRFLDWVKAQGSRLEVVEIEFGADEGKAQVLRHNLYPHALR